MITVQKAKDLIIKNQERGMPENAALDHALGQVVARDIHSPVAVPLFDASAMDGFAIRARDTMEATEDKPVRLKILEEIWAGKRPQKEVIQGHCARIMTGAMIPKGADAVVMQEHVTIDETGILLTRPVPQRSHIRYRGEELQKGDLLLAKGTRLSAPVIGLLAGAGIKDCPVYPRPRVVIIPTGSELAKPGNPPKPGEIYESNSYALTAALAELTITAVVSPIIRDNRNELYKAVDKALGHATHVILCGGVSVGDYDFNKSVLADMNVEPVFWKVAQKPGKPLFFGTRGKTTVFGLPGNPASSLLCFYEYVRPALLKYMGYAEENLFLPEKQAVLLGPVSKKRGKTYFIRGRAFENYGKTFAHPLPREQSHMMSSFAKANCFIVMPEDVETLRADDLATIHCFGRPYDR